MDKDLIETKDGFSVYLIQDSDAQSPEDNSGDDGDDLLFVVTTSNRYFQCRDEKRDHTPEAVTAGTWKKTHWAFPLFMYAHSGVALSLGRGGQFSDPWDSGQVGFVLVNKKAEPHWRLQANALKAAECLVEQWNQYLSGDVWGYVVEGPDGEDGDSCWGFYGRDYAEAEAKDALTYAVKAHNRNEVEARTMMAL